MKIIIGITVLTIIILIIIIYIYKQPCSNTNNFINNLYNTEFKFNNKIINIPLNIYQTWSTLNLPPKMQETVDELKLSNPEFKHYLYNDNMCRDFIKENFNKDVLYAFDKLKPGAYKADLFRYCVLYINGGVYLDIKYKCANNFKLIYLMDKEHFVRDHDISDGTYGIYQALLICYPYNNILLKCIHEIINNVKNNYYNFNNDTPSNSLAITGPLLMSRFFYQKEIKNLVLNFDITREYINYKDIHILKVYNEYRKEIADINNYTHYNDLYKNIDIYNYLKLDYINRYDFSRTIVKNINNKSITFYASSPSIISYNNKYIMNIRWVNYILGKNMYDNFISLNSRFELDKNFNQISNEMFLEETDTNYFYNGIEDIRLFNFNNNIYYIGSSFNKEIDTISITTDLYNYNNENFIINKKFINPDFYDVKISNKTEKNWCLFNYNGEIAVIYSWFPINICKIVNDKLINIEYKYNIPSHFINARGSTPGYTFNNEIWFVVHKQHKNMNYQHQFVIFDLNMNLLKYSELFKLENSPIEYCIGLIVEINRIILSYSVQDKSSIISIYDKNYINNNLIWYENKQEFSLLI
jgi:mannosyltransferase OCH1-like enzyme